MSAQDLFGLAREQKLLAAGVRKVFTPHEPIRSQSLFFGRQREVQSLIEQLNTPGQHALLFGDRGVGKSSLANVAADLILGALSGKVIKKRCDSTDSFKSVVQKALHEVGVNIYTANTETAKREGGSAGLNLGIARENLNAETTQRVSEVGLEARAGSPSWVASQIKGIEGLFLIDEVDVLRSREDKYKIAELVKQLSDEGSSLKLLLVGIAETAVELTAGHNSVQRCLKETKLGRMRKEELEAIIEGGQRQVDLQFSRNAISKITAVSSGYPHFTHLLALKAAEDAIAEDRSYIHASHVVDATNRAVDDAEGTLKSAYQNAIRSSSDEYRKILLAAAQHTDEEITATGLREKYSVIWKENISQNALNNYFQRLVSNDESAILRRLAQGVYKFTDPRMPSFIRIANLPETE